MTNVQTPKKAPEWYAAPTQRYQAAWAEVNARIQSRLVIQGSFMTGVVVTLLLGLVPPGADMADPSQWRTAAVVMLPVLAFATALWVRHNDAIIGLLAAFMQQLEALDDPSQTESVPGWQDSRYKAMDAALRYRRFSDWAFVIVAIAGTAPAGILLLHGAVGPFTLTAPSVPLYPLVGLGFGAVGVFLVLRNATVRTKIKDNWIFGPDSNGKNTWHWK